MPCSIFFHHSVPFLISLNLLFRTIKSCDFCFVQYLFQITFATHPIWFFSPRGFAINVNYKNTNNGLGRRSFWRRCVPSLKPGENAFISRWDRDAVWSKGKAHGHPEDFYVQGLFEFWLQPRPMSPHSLWFYFSCIAYFQGRIWVSEVLWEQTLWDNVKGGPW